MEMDEQHRIEFRRLPMHLVAPVGASAMVTRIIEEARSQRASRTQACAQLAATMLPTPVVQVLATFEDLVRINLALAQELSRLRESWMSMEVPAISRPLHLNGASLPIGVPAAAPYWREDVLLQLAPQREEAAPWATHRPAIGA
jgi:Asp-tRNA(Asn)/Glu-tRNA(Gln) amidotransferase A subunit family amidase